MVAAGMPNDQVSSLYIPSGYNVQLFKNDNFNSLIGKNMKVLKQLIYGLIMINYHHLKLVQH